ncbi:MAG: T9SS type A sorting domain-containing protein [FCB group bacterium]|nr:T9SS type A sorting domain-containing protein [FCB group bacterium]
MNEEFYVTGTTDNNGQVTLTFQNPPTLPGACTLTVFSWNATPSIETIDVIPPSGPYVIYDSYLIEDDLTGNGNGQLDYGEEVELTMTIENVGVEPAYDVSTTISSADPLVTIIDGEEDFGDIPAGATATIERAYSFEIDASVEEGHQVVFMLSASDGVNTWETNFIVTAHAPVVEFQSLLVDDQAGGNGNGNLDPGETADLIVQLFNSGSSYVEAVEALLSSGDPFITINTANAVYGDMNAGSSAEGTFNITVSQSCPQEYDVDFALNITGGLGYTNLTGFTTTVGDITFMPSGPDNFGYLAYDPNDAPELPVYDWVEISPDSGGFGTLIPFTSDDQAMQFPLPFTFQYYGVDYDTFSIGCNGWISMGINTVDDYSNSGIPNGDGPSAMIAPFWEDLSPQRPNSGRVWRWYDTAEHRFIIEYNHVEQYAPTGAFETFQVILYDPAHYTTASGDGRILFQYKDMSVTSATEGTVGIESPNQTDGIQYLFDGALDIHAMMVGDGMSILFTTATSTPTMTVSLTPASTPVIIPAAGGSFDYTIDITNDDTAPVFFDAWIEAELPSGSLYGVLLREGLSLAPNASIVRNMTQNVPASAPAGDYSYIAKTGDHPSTVFAEDSFPFEKLAGDNSSNNFNTWELTGWDGEEAVVVNTPVKYSLSQNYPNPFNPETTISFAIPNNGRVFLKIFNVLGEHVATLMDGELNAGYYQLNWRAEGLSSGMYFYKLEAPGFSSVKKMILMR